MSIEIRVQIEAPELSNAMLSLAAALSGKTIGLAAAFAEPTADTSKSDKPSRSNRSTPKPEPQKDADPVKDETRTQPAPEETGNDAGGEAIPTVVELRAKAQEVGTTQEAKKAIKGLLDQFGSKSISDVPEDQRAAFLKALEELA